MTRGEGGDDAGGADEAALAVQIIAASAVVRAGLAALISADERFEVSGTFATAAAAQNEIELNERPADVIIVEISQGPSDEISELAATRADDESGAPAVVALIPHSQQGTVVSLLRSGLSAVLPNTATGEEIIGAVEAARAGLVVLPREALNLLAGASATQDSNINDDGIDHEALTERLTARERQILDMMAEGLGNKEIAWQLQISEHTVKFHVSSILGKLGAASRTEAVTLGLRRGLIMM